MVEISYFLNFCEDLLQLMNASLFFKITIIINRMRNTKSQISQTGKKKLFFSVFRNNYPEINTLITIANKLRGAIENFMTIYFVD